MRLSLIVFAALGLASIGFTERPNIVMIVTDEEVVIPPGWRDQLEPWYAEHMPAHRYFQEHGMTFAHHHGGQFACTPARTNMYTGHYGDVTRVTQTNGFGKDEDDPDMTWLAENHVPTIGNFLEAAGYAIENISYVGKFHLNNRDLHGADGRVFLTLDSSGQPILENIMRYHDAKSLLPYGFSDWVGPEPHGPNPLNSGSVRDPDFIEQAIAIINRKTEDYYNNQMKPFFLTLNLVNPHDIVLAIGLWMHGKLVIDKTVPDLPSLPALAAGSFEEPLIHDAYRKIYKDFYSKHPLVEDFYGSEEGKMRLARFYYTLLKRSNTEVKRFLDALAAAPFFDNTYVMYTSDHGDLMGRSDRFQKWHSTESAVTHVPFYVAHPSMEAMSNDARIVHQHTSHADIVPTILGLLDIDESKVAALLKHRFTAVHHLVGQDLSPIIRQEQAADPARIVYSISQDNISEGQQRKGKLTAFKPDPQLFPGINFPSTEFDVITGRSHVEAIRFFEDDHQWSFHRYYNPEQSDDEEYYLYDAAADSFETTNLALNDIQRFEQFKKLLEQERVRHRYPSAW